MTLPLTRDITLASKTQIPSTLLNNLQDMIIGGKHGPKTKKISPSSYESQATHGFADNKGTYSASDNGDVGFGLNDGERILSYGVLTENFSAAGDHFILLLSRADSGVAVALDGVKLTTTSGIAKHKDIFTLATPETVSGDNHYFLAIQADGGNVGSVALYTTFVTYDRP